MRNNGLLRALGQRPMTRGMIYCHPWREAITGRVWAKTKLCAEPTMNGSLWHLTLSMPVLASWLGRTSHFKPEFCTKKADKKQGAKAAEEFLNFAWGAALEAPTSLC